MESEEIEFKLIDKTKKIEATLSSRQPQNTNEASAIATSEVPQENTIATNTHEIPSSTPNGNVSARLPKLILNPISKEKQSNGNRSGILSSLPFMRIRLYHRLKSSTI